MDGVPYCCTKYNLKYTTFYYAKNIQSIFFSLIMITFVVFDQYYFLFVYQYNFCICLSFMTFVFQVNLIFELREGIIHLNNQPINHAHINAVHFETDISKLLSRYHLCTATLHCLINDPRHIILPYHALCLFFLANFSFSNGKVFK